MAYGVGECNPLIRRSQTLSAPSTPEGTAAIHIAPWNFPFRQPTFLEGKKYSQDGKSNSMSKDVNLTKE